MSSIAPAATPQTGLASPGYQSILAALGSLLPSRTLLWHYRSRDERLIAVSNQEVYGGSLITFPGPAGSGWAERAWARSPWAIGLRQMLPVQTTRMWPGEGIFQETVDGGQETAKAGTRWLRASGRQLGL